MRKTKTGNCRDLKNRDRDQNVCRAVELWLWARKKPGIHDSGFGFDPEVSYPKGLKVNAHGEMQCE